MDRNWNLFIRAGDGSAELPTFVDWIFFSLFIFFNTFAINMALQIKSGEVVRLYI